MPLLPSFPFTLRIATGLMAAWLLGCAGNDSGRDLRAQPDWRLIPEATVLNQDRQFFLYGRRLDSVTVTVPPSVSMDKGPFSQAGRVLSLHIRVAPLGKDSLAAGESAGLREVRIKTPDTALVFQLKIIDEALPR